MGSLTSRKPTQSPDISYRTLRLDNDEKAGYLDGEPIKLTKTEYDLLLFFLTHRCYQPHHRHQHHPTAQQNPALW